MDLCKKCSDGFFLINYTNSNVVHVRIFNDSDIVSGNNIFMASHILRSVLNSLHVGVG